MTRGLVLSLLIGAVSLVPPYFSKIYFDSVYPARDFPLLHALVIGVAAFSLAAAFMSALRSYYTQVLGASLGSAVGLMYFNHLQHLPTRFFDERSVGEITSRLGDMRGALGAVSRAVQTLLISGVYILLVPPYLIVLNWKLSALALVTTPITLGVSIATGRVTRRYMKQAAEASAELNAIQTEALSQIRTLKSLAAEHRVFRTAVDEAEDARRMQLRAAGIGALFGIVNAAIRTAGTAVFTWYAWTLVLRGEMTVGTFVAFSAYLGYLTGPASQVANLFADFQQSTVTLGRAFEYLELETEQEPEAAYSSPKAITRRVQGDLSLKSVTFGYAPERAVLKEVSLSFSPGTVTAVVGPTGAGKSTILRLLCRMERPTSGSITIDGAPIESIPLSDLRRQIGIVWQEPTLLRGTVWDNLTIGLDAVSRARVEDAIRACRLEALLDSLPNGLETEVAEWGSTLSGGQRQRFALARALVRDPPVLLLDEATSQVDVCTEEEILRELIRRVRDRTVVLVTHRMPTAAIADRICLLDGGAVAATGTHDQLMRESTAYCQMTRAGFVTDEQRGLRILGVT